jgi:hypothetical protein
VLSIYAFNQVFEVPQNIKYETLEDYVKQEDNILAAIYWMENIPVSVSPQKWANVQYYFFNWLEGCSYIPVETGLVFKNLRSNQNPEIFVVYIGGWVRYAITTKDYNDTYKKTIAGIDAIINYYEKYQNVLGHEAGIERYIRLKNSGMLNGYVEDIVKQEIKEAKKEAKKSKQ